ncbi:MAG: hypothetical protein MUO97_08945, partial [Dehalococcoidia bacterium]|nr:hypothetical protein [Dehalococcoidia bacterium]
MPKKIRGNQIKEKAGAGVIKKRAAVKQKPWWTQRRWIGSMVGGIAVVVLIAAGVVWGPALFSTGKETPQVISFTMASETVAEDECPVFNFEVANCSAITITQDGEIITEVEITVPPGTPAASLQPRHGEVYALTETQPGVETHYSPGVYPVIYKGCSSGRPATILWKFKGTGTEKVGSAVLEVSSLDGQVVKTEVTYNIVSSSERPSDQHAVIIAPDCAKQGASSTVESQINYFGVENPQEMVEEGWQPKFGFSASGASALNIKQGDEDVFSIALIVLIVRERRSVSLPWQGEAYALTENQPGVEPRYCPSIYPVGYKGNSNGKPSKIKWGGVGDENKPEPFATITVCSLSGDVFTEVLPFFV